MSLTIEPLTPALFPAFRNFVDQLWDRPRTESYYRWRYHDAPDLVTLVAHQNGRCLATASAFKRPYRLSGDRVDCLETFDWYCLPEMRGSGLGIRVMKTFMDTGHPIVTLGGSRDTLELLPRLGFEHIATGHRYILPMSGAFLRVRPGRRSAKSLLMAAVLDVAGPVIFRRSARRSPARDVLMPMSTLDDWAYDLEETPAFHALHARPWIDWLTRGFPGLGWFLPFGFVQEGRALGWALARLYETKGSLFGKLLDLRYSVTGTPHLAAMVRSVVGTLCGMGAESIATTITCPVVAASLRRNRFLRYRTVPAFVWPGSHKLSDDAVRISMLRGDDSLPPLPSLGRLRDSPNR